jgi:hypothetical protein
MFNEHHSEEDAHVARAKAARVDPEVNLAADDADRYVLGNQGGGEMRPAHPAAAREGFAAQDVVQQYNAHAEAALQVGGPACGGCSQAAAHRAQQLLDMRCACRLLQRVAATLVAEAGLESHASLLACPHLPACLSLGKGRALSPCCRPPPPPSQGALYSLDHSAPLQLLAAALATRERLEAEAAAAVQPGQELGGQQRQQHQQLGAARGNSGGLEDLLLAPAPSYQQLNIHDPRRYFQNMGGGAVAAGAAAGPAAGATVHDAVEVLQQVVVRPGQPLHLSLAPELLELVGGLGV